MLRDNSVRLTVAGVIVAMVLQVAFALHFYRSIRALSADLAAVDAIYAAHARLGEALGRYDLLRIAWREYLIEGRTERAEMFDGQARAITRLLDGLAWPGTVSPAEQQALGELRERVAASIASLRHSMQGSDGRPLGDPRALDAVLQALGGEVQAVQKLADVLRRNFHAGVHAARERHREASARVTAASIVGALAGVLLLGGVCVLTLRQLRDKLTAQGAARQHADNLRDLYDHAPCGYFSLDADGTFVRVNQTLLRWLGYTQQEVLGRLRLPDLYRGTSPSEFAAGFDHLKAAGAARYERELIRKDGSTFHALLEAGAVYGADGEFVMSRTSVTDISDYKRVQEELDRFFSIVPDMLCVIDREWRFKRVNPAWQDSLGYAPDELLNRSFLDFMHPDDRPSTSALMHGRIAGSYTGKTTNRYQHKDGSVRWFEWADATHEGQLYGAARDVTERRQAERAAAESAGFDRTHEQMLTFFNSSHDQRWVLDNILRVIVDDHDFLVAEAILHDEWGDTLTCLAHRGAGAPGVEPLTLWREPIIGDAMTTREPIVLEPGIAVGDSALIAAIRALAPATTVVICPIYFQDRFFGVLLLASLEPVDGKRFAFLKRVARTLGVGLVHIDQFNDLRVMAEELRVRSEDIARINEQLREASRMKSEFLANMSHELRTPLNAIIGFSEVLRDGLAGELSAQQAEYIADICDSGKHLLALINDILDLSKIEAGKMSFDLEAADLHTLLQGALVLLREQAADARVKLSLQLNDELGAVAVDTRKLRQIAYNLLSNAVKFTPAGGAVEVSTRRVGRAQVIAQILRSAPPHTGFDEFVEIAVRDTGIGIAAPDLARLFEPFVQVESSLARHFEGTGLGLVLVKRLVELHGGAVAVTSEPGVGSTFYVWLPYRRAAQDEVGRVLQSITPPLARATGSAPLALVVEDDDGAAELIRVHLEREGFEVVRAASAEGALAHMQRRKPDIVTLDILLPDVDGWSFLERIKGGRDFREVPVIVISIVADDTKGFALGATSVLQKPFAKDKLLEALAALARDRPSLAHAPGTILVVDDDPRAVELLAQYLGQRGFTVLRAFGGREAISVATRALPDLIVLDLMMPEVNGFDVLSALRAEVATATIPVLVLTAKTVSAEDYRHLNSHIHAVVQKSRFDFDQFLRQVKASLGDPPAER